MVAATSSKAVRVALTAADPSFGRAEEEEQEGGEAASSFGVVTWAWASVCGIWKQCEPVH